MARKKQSDIIVEKIIDWLNTDEGKREFQEAMDRADKASEEFRKACQIDWRTLHIPFGPADGSGIWPHQRP